MQNLAPAAHVLQLVAAVPERIQLAPAPRMRLRKRAKKAREGGGWVTIFRGRSTAARTRRMGGSPRTGSLLHFGAKDADWRCRGVKTAGSNRCKQLITQQASPFTRHTSHVTHLNRIHSVDCFWIHCCPGVAHVSKAHPFGGGGHTQAQCRCCRRCCLRLIILQLFCNFKIADFGTDMESEGE